MNIFTIILTQPLANGLILFYDYFGHNLGVATILFSICLFLITRPLSKPQMESMKKIREIQPLVDKLKKKYGKDKMAFSKAQAELYKQKKINPGAGCIFQILQLVILIAFYQVFSSSLANTATSLKKLNALLYTPLKLVQHQTLNTQLFRLGSYVVDVGKKDLFLIHGLPLGIPGLPGILLILATLAQFLSIKVTAPYIKEEDKMVKSTKGDADDMQLAMSSSMMYTVPLMTLYFGYTFPASAGLALYWLVFSLGTLVQQVSMNGWGGLTPFLRKLNLLKSKTQ
jgi:YidC/Oxa1 family membrane protein insertase